jgi:hypothetical protein
VVASDEEDGELVMSGGLGPGPMSNSPAGEEAGGEEAEEVVEHE